MEQRAEEYFLGGAYKTLDQNHVLADPLSLPVRE